MIYLDNAASSHPKPEAVYAAVDGALRLGANPGRSAHSAALEAARIVFRARQGIAELIGAEDSSRIVFTSNGTHSLNLALRGFLRSGDHVVTTCMEHNSVLRPLAVLEDEGVQVSVVGADPAGRVRPEEIGAAVGSRTKLVVLSHASNVSGTLQDVEAVGALCRDRGVVLLVDAAQTAGAVPIHVTRTGVGLLAAPGHKGLLGPQGTGFLYVAPDLELRPLLVGGTGVLSESREMPEELPEALEAGTLNTPALAGLAAGVEYLLERGVEDVRRHELQILEHLLPGLEQIPDLQVYGPSDPAERVAVVSFNLEGRDGAHLGHALDQVYGIAVRVGLHCAPDAHKRLGTFPRGTVRASFGALSTRKEADSLVRALVELGAVAG